MIHATCVRGAVLTIRAGIGGVGLFSGAPLVQRRAEHSEMTLHGDGGNNAILRNKNHVISVQGVALERIDPIEDYLLIR
jgi:hypothetical protein